MFCISNQQTLHRNGVHAHFKSFKNDFFSSTPCIVRSAHEEGEKHTFPTYDKPQEEATEKDGELNDLINFLTLSELNFITRSQNIEALEDYSVAMVYTLFFAKTTL